MDGNLTAYALADRLAAAEQRLAEYDQLFDIQWKRMQHATELWRAEAPQERALVQPDLGNLLAWLIEKAGMTQRVEPVVSLGEQPHDPGNCFMNHGRPHLGPCMDAEAFTRWFWMEGPGSQPVSSTHIAIATQQLVREAFEARTERQERQRLAANERFLAEALPDADERARQRGLGPDA
jgi:hypothetical protein